MRCGILTEASLDCESGSLSYAVPGIGINTAAPAGDFPPELQGIAGAVFDGEKPPELRCRLAARVLDKLMAYSADPGDPALFEAYQRRSLVLGKPINILMPGAEPVRAEAVALCRKAGLDRAGGLVNAAAIAAYIRRRNPEQVSLVGMVFFILTGTEQADNKAVAVLIGKVVAVPTREDIDLPVEERLIVELYSK